MAAQEYNKLIAMIRKADLVSEPIYTGGASLRFVGWPTNVRDGTIDLDGSAVQFEGSFNGSEWFSVNDYGGAPISILAKVSQNAHHAAGGLDLAPACLPIRDPQLFKGIQMLRIRANAAQTGDRRFVFHFGD
jgi:hypothetical protein